MLKGKISIVLPAYNEGSNILRLYEHMVEVLSRLPYSYELLFINDGSSDQTFDKIKEVATIDSQVKYVSFSRNFGKEAAIYAGLQHATGDAVILMDSDLQHPPSLISKLIEGYEQGYHQVIACRNRTGESLGHRMLTATFYKMMNKVSDVNLKNGEGDFRLLSRKAVEALLQLSEGNRFSKGLYEWIGLSKKTIYYENVMRENGKSKWSLTSLLSYALDGALSFNTKPLRLCLYIGMIAITFGILYVSIMLVGILIRGIDMPGYFTVISAVLIFGGFQILCLGIIGEYIGRIYNETKKRPHYIMDETNVNSHFEYPKPTLVTNIPVNKEHINVVRQEAK